MAIYFLSANSDVARAIERRIRRALPDVKRITRLPDIALDRGQKPGELDYVLFPAPSNDKFYIDRLIELAPRYRNNFFFVLICEEISASDYKRLVQSGGADWVSARAPAQDLLDTIRRRRGRREVAHNEPEQPVVVSFVPSAGGVGNSTLAIETAVRFKLNKTTRSRRVCIIDLDFQTSHLCDYLDLEPRLNIQEIVGDPERFDDQLFDVFVRKHASGVDVLVAPRSKFNAWDVHIDALDALFEKMAARYEFIFVDMPVTWFPWTRPVISASSGLIVTGQNTVPGLRQIVETLAAVRNVGVAHSAVAVAVNRCRHRMLGGVVHRQHIGRMLGSEKVFLVRDEPLAIESVNTGEPLVIAHSLSKLNKDIAAIAEFCRALKPSPARHTNQLKTG